MADTAAARASDTIVRRIVRVRRLPSAMQRVTGELNVAHALRPLDSTLAIRVMDQRGRELSNVRVSWTLANAGDGAQLRLINARTDSLGISRAAFTPGRTAITQTVAADVERVGRISFHVTVPAASIRLVAAEPSFWSGDLQTVAAELRDAAGTILAAGPLVWGSTDSTILAVHSSDATRAVVRGMLAGAAELVAWIEPGTIRGSARLSVKPEVSGTFVTLDGKAVPPLLLEVRSGTLIDSIAVTESRFRTRIDLPSGDAELRATPLGVTTHHAARIRVTVPRALQRMRIALVPTTWRIDTGTYAGQSVPIDAAAAMRRSPGGAAFWRLPPDRGRTPALLGWPESAFPLRVAFNRGRSHDPISASDSAEFWEIAEQLQRDLGGRFFVPAQMTGDSIPTGVVTVEVAGGSMEGHTFVTWNEGGDIYDGVLMFQRASTLRGAHVVTHELLHLLGFGHATSFRSVSRAGAFFELRLTPEDVAYAQVAMRLRRLQGQSGARPGLPVTSP
jgi:hypothetical protein